MLENLSGKVWRLLPARFRRWTMRATHTRFTVTAGAIVFNDAGQVLLLKHRFRAGSGWGLPGGFLEAGEQPLDALRRELREEIGMEIKDPEVFAARSFRQAATGGSVVSLPRQRHGAPAKHGSRTGRVVFCELSAGRLARRSATFRRTRRCRWSKGARLMYALPAEAGWYFVLCALSFVLAL
jgi:ADP-ribose pyrophosphatase YjhB (NUDIX family)